MKVYFGDALEEMSKELRGKAVRNVRLQALTEVAGETLEINVHVTTLCNQQVYESVLSSERSLEGIAPEERPDFVKQAREEAQQSVEERMQGFEVRRGILQQ